MYLQHGKKHPSTKSLNIKYLKEYQNISFAVLFKDQFPLLAFLVRVVFVVPEASSKSERVFSLADLVVSSLRNRLSPVKVENIATIHSNLPILKEMGIRK